MLMYIYAVTGIPLFKEQTQYDAENLTYGKSFDGISNSFSTIFILLTVDHWYSLLEEGWKVPGLNKVACGAFVISWIILGAFIFRNLFVGFMVSAVWELLGIDLTGPLPKTTSGFQYILTVTDYFSKWVEAFPLRSKCAAEVGKNLCLVIYRHGCPKRVLSDQGREFVNELNQSLCELLSIERSVRAAYHPQTNGLDEKTNDNIKR
ncbi:hypothetical protein SRHO_G00326800 [Serrasalmus rhombeus]